MNQSAITVRYAKALYQVAVEEGVLEQVKQDVEAIQDCFIESAELIYFLYTPILKESEKSVMIREVFEGKVNKLTLNFLLMLVVNKRENYLSDICRNFMSYYKETLGYKEATIITAQSIDKKHREEIVNYVAKKFQCKIELKEQVDPSIIGGFKLRIEDQQIDASISSTLKKIKRKLINS